MIMSKIVLENIETDRFNPFEATAEELLANALHDSGLINPHTLINGEAAEEFLTLFFAKRSVFRDATLLGKMLMETGKIPHDKLREALRYQKEHKGMKIGEVLVKLNLCASEDIDNCLDLQKKKREDAL